MTINISGFLIFVGLLSYFQIRQLLAKEGKKEIVVYVIFMSLAVITGLLLIAGVKIPSHNIIIIRIFEPIGKFILGK